MRGRRGAGVLLVACLALAGCASGQEGAAPSTTDAVPEPPVIVFAAASLQASFDELAAAFQEANPRYRIAPIRYDGSQALAAQILDGADADVIAFASEPSLAPVREAGLVDRSTVFASNTLRIAVAPGNPKGIATLEDLAAPGLGVVLCAPAVPCGAASQSLLADAGVAVHPVTEETNVAAVLRRVADGEADAGLVYATDVHDARGTVDQVVPANADRAVNRYPLAVARHASSPEGAGAFAAFVLSDAGQRILDEHGFGRP